VADIEYMAPDFLLLKLKSQFLFLSAKHHMPLAYKGMFLKKIIPWQKLPVKDPAEGLETFDEAT